MTGPLPKNPAQRRRTNKTSTAANLSPLSLDELVDAVPDMPEGYDLGVAGEAVWIDTWESPMSREFDRETDRHGVAVMASLHDDFQAATSPNQRALVAAEIRLQRAEYGLAPYSRRRLQWAIQQTELRARQAQLQQQAVTSLQKIEHELGPGQPNDVDEILDAVLVPDPRDLVA